MSRRPPCASCVQRCLNPWKPWCSRHWPNGPMTGIRMAHGWWLTSISPPAAKCRRGSEPQFYPRRPSPSRAWRLCRPSLSRALKALDRAQASRPRPAPRPAAASQTRRLSWRRRLRGRRQSRRTMHLRQAIRQPRKHSGKRHRRLSAGTPRKSRDRRRFLGRRARPPC